MNGLSGLIERVLLAIADSAAVRLHSKGPAVITAAPEALGYEIESNLPIEVSAEERRRHLYVLGATGSGKTNFLLRLIEQDLRAKRSLIVIDLRGDLIDRILLRLAASEDPAAKERLCLLDLRRDHLDFGFNPLAGTGEPQSRAFHLLGVVRSQAESWGVQLEETLRSSLVALAESGGTLLDIEPLLTNSAFRTRILCRCQDPYVLSFFERFDDLSADKQTSWVMPVLNKVTPLLSSPAVRACLESKQTIDLRELMDRPGQILLVSLAVHRLQGAAYLLGGLLVSSIQSAAMARVDQPENKRNPVNLYIDEFETMASPAFEAIIAEGRRFGLALTLSHQNLSQVPAGLRQVVRNNVHTQLFFQTGALDAGELATEITGLGSREEVRTTLMIQAVGRAVLVRRGEPAVRIRTLPVTDPAPSPEELERLKTGAASQPAQEPIVTPAQLEPEQKPKQEVRHGKRPGRI